MPVPTYRAPKDSKPYGLFGYLKDFISPPGYQARGPFGARPAAAAPGLVGRAPTDAELAAEGFGFGPYEYDPFKRPRIAGRDIGGDGRSDEARALASQYAPKPFPMTQAGQFERYFQTPEMDQYFGVASRGAAAPKTAAAMQELAGQTVAPGTTPEELSAYYRAQSAMGRAQMPQIQGALGFIKGSPMARWAEANPMLAQRLYAKQQERFGAQSEGVADLGARAQSESGYAGTFREQPGLFQAVGNPVVPTEDRSATGMTQGERVDVGRGAPNLRPWQLAKTNPMNAASFNQ